MSNASRADISRTQWPRPISFIFALLGYCISVSDVLMFTYKCALGGGGEQDSAFMFFITYFAGSFLIAYGVLMLVIGIPMMAAETVVGQMYKQAPVQVMKRLAPPVFAGGMKLKYRNHDTSGIGVSMVLISLSWALYYAMIAVWMLRYLWLALTVNMNTSANNLARVMPWLHCNNSWNSPGTFYPPALLHPTAGCEADQDIITHFRTFEYSSYVNCSEVYGNSTGRFETTSSMEFR
jgi:solute carrier family 6 dopamine transporter-like protein 3